MIEAFRKAGLSEELLKTASDQKARSVIFDEKLKQFKHLELKKYLSDFIFPGEAKNFLSHDYLLMINIFPYLEKMYESRVEKYVRKYKELGITEMSEGLKNLIFFKATVEMIYPVIDSPENYKDSMFKSTLIIILDAYQFRLVATGKAKYE